MLIIYNFCYFNYIIFIFFVFKSLLILKKKNLIIFILQKLKVIYLN